MNLFNDPTHGISTESSGDEWYTPPEILERLPPIGLDPCWSPASLVKADVTYDIRQGQDGLALPWIILDGIVFANPPFSNTVAWLEKAQAEARTWGQVVVVLVPASAGDGPWNRHVWPHASFVGFSRGRVQFIGPDGKRETKGRGHALILFGFSGECELVARGIGSELFNWVRPVEF